jgi:hypothetical protein
MVIVALNYCSDLQQRNIKNNQGGRLFRGVSLSFRGYGAQCTLTMSTTAASWNFRVLTIVVFDCADCDGIRE